jgi:hypothetical protein
MVRAALLLLPAIALASCNSQPAAPTPAQNETVADNEAVDKGGAERLFNAPADGIANLNQFGFRLRDYAAAANGYAAKGAPITLSQSDASAPNTATVDVTGSGAQTIDRIVFTLSLTDAANADTAKQRLSEIVTGFLFQYGIEDAGALANIVAERNAQGQIDGTPFTVAVAQGATGKTYAPRRLTFTLQRPAASGTSDTPAQNIT